MDTRLFESALTGDVQKLRQLLGENPLILHTVALASSGNPLHVASAYGHIDFAREILRLRPDFAKESNEDGFSPMHLASANGHLDVVGELLKVDWRLCRLQGPEKKPPLHCAAIKGRVDVVSVVLSACVECLEDVTVRRESALHLAIRNNQFEVIRILVDWIKHIKKENIFNMKDEHGNTALHLATWKKQREVIEVLLDHEASSSGLWEVNAINQSDLTAVDVLLTFPSEAGDREIEEILRSAGAMRNKDFIPSSIPSPSPESHNRRPEATEACSTQSSNNLVDYFKFKKGRDSPGETRTALLVVAVLVATTTFQVGINPPGGLWQDSYTPEQNNSTRMDKTHFAGRSISAFLNPVGFEIFILFNSIGFALSLHMIYILTFKFPFQFELQICIVAMFTTYNTAVANIIPDGIKIATIISMSIISVVTPFIVKRIRQYSRRLQKSAVNLIHRCRMNI
ncbi:hypothetical protein ACOSQ2_000256 [Xanthoceras sorbifolium]